MTGQKQLIIKWSLISCEGQLIWSAKKKGKNGVNSSLPTPLIWTEQKKSKIVKNGNQKADKLDNYPYSSVNFC